MIALDSSSLIAFLSGYKGSDVEVVETALAHNQAVLPPIVLSELLSDPELPPEVQDLLKHLPLLEVHEGYWERAGKLRAKVIAKGRRARLADTLIAQTCLDHDVALATRDADFQNFAQLAGLRLL